jgi:hypothetical protein
LRGSWYQPQYDASLLASTFGVADYPMKDRKNQWGPRFGVAWDVPGDSRLVIRTGGGIYYDRYQGNRIFNNVNNSAESVQPTLYYGFAQQINPATAFLGPPDAIKMDPSRRGPPYLQLPVLDSELFIRGSEVIRSGPLPTTGSSQA